jgi:hypothetical protein
MARFGDTRAIGVVREMLDRTRLDKVERMRPDQKEATMLAAIDPDQKREMPLNLAIILSLWHRNITASMLEESQKYHDELVKLKITEV